MAINLVYDSIEAVPEAWRSDFAKGDDGKFRPSEIAGYVPKSKHDEFRETNVTLLKQRDELNAKIEQFKDIDPAKAREALKKLQDLDHKNLVDKGQFEKAWELKQAALIADKEAAVAAARTEADQRAAENQALTDRLFALEIEQEISAVWSKPELGFEPSAVRDAQDAAKLRIKSKDGKFVCHGEDGKPLYNGKGEPATVKEWIESLLPSRPHWQRKSQGAGGAGNPGGAGAATGADLMKLSPAQRMALGRRAA